MLFYPRHSFDCEVRQKVNTINIIFKVRVEREREREREIDDCRYSPFWNFILLQG